MTNRVRGAGGALCGRLSRDKVFVAASRRHVGARSRSRVRTAGVYYWPTATALPRTAPTLRPYHAHAFPTLCKRAAFTIHTSVRVVQLWYLRCLLLELEVRYGHLCGCWMYYSRAR